ncbi:MAG: hypothetical protein M3N98_00130 [Actinomycetota bacterium]|nr:hypothetical protein [Actinomycetota bacterium]
MISPLWWAPLVLVAAAIIPLWFATRRLSDEVAALRASTDGLRQVRTVLAEVRGQIIAARRSLEHLAHR